MLKPKRMTKIRIVGSQNHLSSFIAVLHTLKLVHLVDHIKTDQLDIGQPLAPAEKISELLVKVRSFPRVDVPSEPSSEDLFVLETEIQEIQQTLQTLSEKKHTLLTQITQKKDHLFQFRILTSLHLSPTVLAPYTSLSSFIGTVRDASLVSQEISAAIPHSHITYSILDDKQYIAVFVPKKKTAAVEAILSKYQYTALAFGTLSEYGKDVNPQTLATELGTLQEKLSVVEQNIAHYSASISPKVTGMEVFLSAALEKAQAPLRFAATARSFVLTGWVSADEYKQLEQRITTEFDGKLFLEKLSVEKTDKVPIALRNLFFVKPFEFFLNLYTLPSYKEIDPSFFLFFSFPFFFGIMLGDVGYGFVTFLLFAALWLTWKAARSLLTVLMISAIISIFFGFIFGEYFGFEHVSESTGEMLIEKYGLPLHHEVLHSGETVYSFPRLMNRLHGEVSLMGITLPAILALGGLLGFIHVNLGIFLGFINEVVSHGFWHAFCTKISWYILELGIVVIALAAIGSLPLPWVVGLVLIILAAVLLFIGEGIQGIVELPSLLTNILSYFRLGAVGLASVGLAVVINENFALPFIEKGGIFIVFGVLLFILGHVINISLGILGPFLHSLRLHYVEFFSKFYRGGGVAFVPFGGEKEK